VWLCLCVCVCVCVNGCTRFEALVIRSSVCGCALNCLLYLSEVQSFSCGALPTMGDLFILFLQAIDH
jgi:hypothetical protein